MYPLVAAAAAAVPVCAAIGASGLIRRPKSVRELVTREDAAMKAHLKRLLDESSPGNPLDREIWIAIKNYGIWHFLDQLLLEVGIFCEAAKDNPDAEARRAQVEEAKRSALIAIAGCMIESLVNSAGIESGRAQAHLAAEMYRSLCVDVEDTISDTC